MMRPIFSQLKQVSLSVMKNSGYLEEAAVCLLSYRLQGSIQSLNACKCASIGFHIQTGLNTSTLYAIA